MPYSGRPTVLDEVKQREICALLSAGCSVQHAAEYVGCSARTIRRCADRDDAFRERLRRAEAGIRLSALETVRRAAATHWRAAAWLLEHGGSWEDVPDNHATRDTNLVEDILEEMDSTLNASDQKPEPLRPPARLVNGQNE